MAYSGALSCQNISALCEAKSHCVAPGSASLKIAYRFAVQSQANSRLSVVAQASGSESRPSPLEAFQNKTAFKVIAGLQNFDPQLVSMVVSAAEKGGATHVDIACDPELVKLARTLTSLPICVSAVDPYQFVAAVEAGCDMVEIGNFDSFYDQGKEFSAEEVLALTRLTRQLLPCIPLSVTVPHKLHMSEQVALAEALQAAGVDVIQTEGGTSSSPLAGGVAGLLEKATPTLAAAHSISRAVSIPVMCASGLSAVTAPLAFAAGASGIGVGSAINKLKDETAMAMAVRSVTDSITKSSEVARSAGAASASH